MADDQVRIDVQVTGQAVVDRLAQSIAALEKDVERLDQEFASGQGDAAQYTAEMSRLTSQIGRQSAAIDQQVAKAGAGISSFVSKYNFEILNLGRVTQDVVQGGLGGALNNIEGFFRKNPAIAGIGTIIGTGLYLAWPQIKKFFDDFTSEIETSEDRVKRLGKEIDEIKKKKYPSTDDLKEYNTKLAEQLAVEKDITAEKERQAKAVKFMQAPTEAQMMQEKTGETEWRKKAIAGMPREARQALIRDLTAGLFVAGNIPGMQQELTGLEAQLGDRALREQLELKGGPGALQAAQVRRDALRKAITRANIDMPRIAAQLAGGIEGGDREALEKVVRTLLPGAPSAGRMADLGVDRFAQDREGRRKSLETETNLRRNAREVKEKEEDMKERVRIANEADKENVRRLDEQAQEDARADKETAAIQERMRKRGIREGQEDAAKRRREAMARAGVARGDFDMGAVAEAGLRNVAAVQQATLQRSNGAIRLTSTEAARMIISAKKEEDTAFKTFVQAVLMATSGTQRRINMLNNATKQVQVGVERPPGPSGLPR